MMFRILGFWMFIACLISGLGQMNQLRPVLSLGRFGMLNLKCSVMDLLLLL